jgi:hypothetical protein
MSVVIDDHIWHKTVGIARNARLRWLKEEMASGVEYRDCRGLRLFIRPEVQATRVETDRVSALVEAVKRLDI